MSKSVPFPCRMQGPMTHLGRGLVCLPGAAVPAEFQHLPRVDDLQELHRCWLERRPVVVELKLSKAELKTRERWTGEVYTLTPKFEFARERLHFLTWANNYDGTAVGPPIWWHSRLACRLGARPCEEADVLLADGPAWCDGGPRGMPGVLHRETIESGRLERTRARSSAAALAPDQARAVAHGHGPARILAPAGSGKTRVLTERLRHLLLDRGYEGERVTALAYNRRAAEEMRQRTADFQPNVRTLHALGFSILRAHSGPRLLEEREVRDILRSLIAVPQVLGQDPLVPYLEALAEVRLGLREPGQVEARRGDVPGLTALFPAYRAKLRQRNLIDHDEQIYQALEVLLSEPELRQKAQRACTHLLVDEFQDLTPAYLLLVRLLSAPSYQVFGVGDDDQVIYGYTGATPEFLVHFEDYFPGAESYALEVNYRCPARVVEAANSLLSRNRQRVVKKVRPAEASSQASIDVLRADHLDWAAQAVRFLKGWLESFEPTQIAVLSRVQASLMALHVYLSEAGVPFVSILSASVLERTGARTALAYLRLARGAFTPVDLRDALRRPNRRLRREIVEQAARCRNQAELARLSDSLEDWPSSQLDEFLRDLSAMGSRRSPEEALRYLRQSVGLGDAMRELDAGGAEASHYDDLVALEQTARLHPSWESFESWLRELLSRPGRPGITLSTVHRVKGMEWDGVLVYGAQMGLLPHRLADDLEEERRIFHVALTRGRQRVAVLADAREPSGFLSELTPPESPSPRKTGRKKRRGGYDPECGRRFAEALGVGVEQLEAALALLEERDREVFCRYYGLADGRRHTPEEIARGLDRSLSACETWRQLAEARLKTALGRRMSFEEAFRAAF
ncbi:MAG: hypothetical protein AMXMBFR33_49270 [Candidatus Xenobia bacterium]